jgi:SAM-dependent methyltransferase
VPPDPDVDAWDAEAESFDEAADHGLRDPRVREAWRRLLLDRLPPAPAAVADLGCGTGTLSLLLADEGYRVDGVDFSPRMLELAERKAAGRSGVRFLPGDAYRPPLPERTYDAVLCRHVLWAMPDPAVALRRWLGLLAPGGTLVLVEGRWSNDVGLPAAETVALVEAAGRSAELIRLTDPVYWGRAVHDERYVVSTGSTTREGPTAGGHSSTRRGK